jgi:hypothetical protein
MSGSSSKKNSWTSDRNGSISAADEPPRRGEDTDGRERSLDERLKNVLRAVGRGSVSDLPNRFAMNGGQEDG